MVQYNKEYCMLCDIDIKLDDVTQSLQDVNQKIEQLIELNALVAKQNVLLTELLKTIQQ